MQGLKLTASTAAEKHFKLENGKVTRVCNVGQGHQFIVSAPRVCREQLLCKV